MPRLDYRNTLAFLYGLERHGIKFGLDVIASMLASLGNPHHRYATLHIAGTNGKGSSAAMAAEILQAAGYRVGLYTSPHVYDFRERIRVQGEAIPEEWVVALTERIRAACAPGSSPTFFEWTTGMAFAYFAERRIDVAVVEVGMGGRLDATNVLMPVGTLITNIARDHEQFLGNTLSAIAYEKAGIIKPDVPVVLGPMPQMAEDVIRRCAAERRAPCYRFGKEFRIQQESGQRFTYHGMELACEQLACALQGEHQCINAACAIALLEIGARRGFRLSETAVRTGLAQVQWPGRLEVWRRSPLILADGAHNPAAAQKLAAYITQLLSERPGSRLIFVIGMMRDKDHAAFLETLAPHAHHVMLTQASLSRAAAPQDLAACLPLNVRHVDLHPSPFDAMLAAERLAGPLDIICITGSLILIGELGVAMRQTADAASLMEPCRVD